MRRVMTDVGKWSVFSSHGGIVRSVAWISHRGNGDVSVGLSDQQAIIGEMSFLDDGRPSAIDFRQTHLSDELCDPHFTFHHPAYFHLKANKKRHAIVSGLVWTNHHNDQDCSPWARLISDTVRELKQISNGNRRKWLLPLASEDCSVALFFDFVNEIEPHDRTSRYLITTENVILRIRAASMLGQSASMGYVIHI